MKKVILIISFFLLHLSLLAQQPSFVWAKLSGGIDGRSLVVDAVGNVYTLGMLSAAGNFDFDPGPGTFILNGANGTGYISKLTTDGNFIWAKQLPTNSTMECIRVDAAQNVYVTGHFSLTLDFDPGPGTFNLTSAGQNDVFILKLNASGDLLWAKNLGGTQADVALSIDVSSDGSVYTTGYFIGTSDFDPGIGVSNMNSGTFGDCFISKLSSDGDYIWALQIPGGFNQAHSLIVDGTGDIIITGTFQGTKDFDPSGLSYTLTSNGSADVFIWKLNSGGGLIWAKNIGGIGSDYDESVTTDPSGNVYVTGGFSFTPDFDPGPGTFNITSFGGDDIYVLKLAGNGSFEWAKQMGGISGEGGKDIKVDASGNVYTTGLFVNSADFDPGPSTFILTSAMSSSDIYISKLDADGNFGWALRFGEATIDQGLAMALDATGNIYNSGFFQGNVDFDPGPGVSNYIVSVRSAYILKLGPGSVLPLSLIGFSAAITTAAEVQLQWQTAQEQNSKEFQVEWSTDGIQYNIIATLNAAGYSSINRQYNYLHLQPADGNNYYRLKMADINGQFTYSNIIKVETKILAADFSISPNPVSDVLHLNIYATRLEKVLFRLHSADGKIIDWKYFNVVKGSNFLNWNVQSIPAGSYFITAANNQFKPLPVIKK
jgi:hypothetical protein